MEEHVSEVYEVHAFYSKELAEYAAEELNKLEVEYHFVREVELH